MMKKKEFISIDQRGQLIKILEDLEEKIAKQNSLKHTFSKVLSMA